MFNSITVCRQDYHGDVELAHVLLEGEIAVDCDENVEPLLSRAQQIAIFAPGPPGFSYRLYLMPGQRLLQLSWQALVKQHAH